jgi:hypothetical protein
MIDGFTCKIKPEKLEAYFSLEQGYEGECRVCRVQPLASLYLKALEDAGAKKSSETLEKAYAGGDVLTIARTMDTIRERAEGQLRQSLEELDCFTQSFKAEDNAETL